MIIEYNHYKNIFLKARGLDFEEIIDKILNGEIIDIIDNPSRNFENQSMFLININNYVVCVPFVENNNGIFLKTAFRSRKYNKHYNS